MNIIEKIAQDERVQAALQDLAAQTDRVVETAVSIQQIAAPTFAEGERATFILSQLEALGLCDVEHDDLYNVYGRLPAASPGNHPPVIISAHMDTVFPLDTDLTVKRDGRYIYGPGLGDNSTGVAGILHLAQTLSTHHLQLPADLWFVANVGEEGLGDLRGMRAVVKRFGREASYIVVEGGLFGQISHQAIGVRRFRIEVNAGGGHSWGNFGRASAIHELAHLIVEIDRLAVSTSPKTTYNVGVIEGGISINSIAQSASMLLDLRSEDAGALAELVKAVEMIVHSARERLSRKGDVDVAINISQIGNRPAGSIPSQSPLVTAAEDALRFVGCEQVNYVASSTDANIPLGQGIPAVCVGLTQSGNAHRLDEFIDPLFLSAGLSHLLLLVLASAGMQN